MQSCRQVHAVRIKPGLPLLLAHSCVQYCILHAVRQGEGSVVCAESQNTITTTNIGIALLVVFDCGSGYSTSLPLFVVVLGWSEKHQNTIDNTFLDYCEDRTPVEPTNQHVTTEY